MTRSKTEGKKAACGLCCCKDCKWADLLQFGNDPLLADFHKKPQPGNERFPYQREVARAMRTCAMHTYEDETKKTVRRLPKRTGWQTYDVRKGEIAA